MKENKFSRMYCMRDGCVALLMICALGSFLSAGKITYSSGFNPWIFTDVVLIAPFMETLVFQLLIFEMGDRLKVARSYTIWISATAFLFVHYLNNDAIHMGFIAFSGAILSYTYSRWLSVSRRVAFALVFIVHSAYNFFMVVNMHLWIISSS